MLSLVELETFFDSDYFNIFAQFKFHAELS